MDDTEDIPLSPFEPISSIEIVSETETVTTNSSNSLNRKKRKNSHTTTNINITKSRNNQSHTSYFFHTDPIDSSITYCKICESNLAGTRQKPYSYN